MEIEQEASPFRTVPMAGIVSTSGIGEQEEKLQYKSNNGSGDKTAKLLKKAAADMYKFMDSLAGHESHYLLDFFDNFSGQPFHEILGLLLDKKFIGGYGLESVRYNDAPFFHRSDIYPNYPEGITDGRIIAKGMGHGFGKDIEKVFSKAIGEFLERFPLTIYHKNNLIRSSSQALKNKNFLTIDLDSLVGFSEEQKKTDPKLQFNEKSIFYWEKAERTLTGQTIYFPAQLIYWNYICGETEPRLCETNTNAAGGMFTEEGAILSGLYELIQRDSYLIYWLNGLSPKRIDPHTIPYESFQSLLAESERYGFEIFCLDLTTDTKVPAFAVIISDPSEKGPRFSLGGGCQADPKKALYRAFEEAWSVYYWMRPRPLFPALDKNYRPFFDRIDQDERLRLWSNPEMAENLRFFISGKEEPFPKFNFDFPDSFDSEKEELDFLAKRIESLGPGYEVYHYLSSHPILSELGYYSAQVIVPQLVRLYLTEFHAPLGSARIKIAPKNFGFSTAEHINPLPHLFP